MLALTLIRPMGWAIVHKHKPFENRVRDMRPWSMRGIRTRIAIHSGKTWDDGYGQMVHHLTGVVPDEKPMHVLGVATFTGRVFTLQQPPPADAPGRAWFFGPFGFEIDTSESFALYEPIPCRGHQGFWHLPIDVELAVRGQLGERAA